MSKQAAPDELLATATRVVVLGDVHGDAMAVITALQAAARPGVTVILSVGDFGIGPWPGERKSFTKAIDRWLTRLGLWLFVTPGNHENYDRIDAAPRDESGAIYLGSQLRALPRGHRLTIGGRTVGSLGGAVSVDVGPHRQPGRTWWPQERILDSDIDALGSEPLDILITHEVPASVPVESQLTVPPKIAASAHQGRELLDRAVETTRPQLVLSGHWHQRVTHTRTWDDGMTTRYEVLPEENRRFNAVVLDLSDLEGELVDLREWSRSLHRADRDSADVSEAR
ncbi:metallophosphoesterase [Cellulosimicrobium sp. RS]|uniref:metallophosphoesterase family protein n=1 Tax=Cellulosimicrobium sp. RS TaxID=3381347 RepID=UPI0038FBF09C